MKTPDKIYGNRVSPSGAYIPGGQKVKVYVTVVE